jgi:tight adherence protein C
VTIAPLTSEFFTKWLDPSHSAGLGSLLLGLAVAWALVTLTGLFARAEPQPAEGRDFEQRRRQAIREGSAIYRWFEPLVEECLESLPPPSSAVLERLRRDLITSAVPVPWTPEEFVAAARFEGLLTAAGAGLVGWMVAGPLAGLFSGLICCWLYPQLKVKNIATLAANRKRRIKKRLPYCLDLMALMLEAGSSFLDCMKRAYEELAGEPLGVEIDRALRELSLGRSRREALEALRDRVADEDLTETVFAINKSEELGTPLSKAFRLQADQMRLKRSQWGEKAASEAQVAIVFPGMLTMLACLIVIVAPFVLSALSNY